MIMNTATPDESATSSLTLPAWMLRLKSSLRKETSVGLAYIAGYGSSVDEMKA